MREIGGSPDHELAVEYERIVAPLARPDQEVVRLNDGRVVWVSYGSANIYASADEYRALLASIEENSDSKWQHPLGTKFSDGQAFIKAVPQLVQQLPAKLRLQGSCLNRSVESLDHIDRGAARFSGPECLMTRRSWRRL
jgi:ABC-type antimicrobial peptide transport system ATPase subunit